MPRAKRPFQRTVSTRPGRRRRGRHVAPAPSPSVDRPTGDLRPWEEADWGAAAIELALFPETGASATASPPSRS